MHPKWLIGLGMIFVISTVLCLVLESQASDVTVISGVLDKFQAMEFNNPVSVGWAVITGLGAILKAIFDVLTWNYSFFIGYWVWVRFLMMTISFGIIISLLLAIRGTSSS